MKPSLHLYRPIDSLDPSVDKKYCRHAVHNGGRDVRFHQCRCLGAREWTDPTTGYSYKLCKMHHPESVKARIEASNERYAKQQEGAKRARIRGGLRDASDDQLEAACVARGWKVTR